MYAHLQRSMVEKHKRSSFRLARLQLWVRASTPPPLHPLSANHLYNTNNRLSAPAAAATSGAPPHFCASRAVIGDRCGGATKKSFTGMIPRIPQSPVSTFSGEPRVSHVNPRLHKDPPIPCPRFYIYKDLLNLRPRFHTDTRIPFPDSTVAPDSSAMIPQETPNSPSPNPYVTPNFRPRSIGPPNSSAMIFHRTPPPEFSFPDSIEMPNSRFSIL